jgi:predicted acylesterase/phospholipase RssA
MNEPSDASNDYPSSQDFTHLTIGGGGCSGFEYIGVMHGLQLSGKSAHIRNVVGISIGAFFGALFAMDADMTWVRRSFEALASQSGYLQVPASHLLLLPSRYCLFDVNLLIKPLLCAMHLRWPDVNPLSMTLRTFCEKIDRRFTVILTELNTSRSVVASPDGMLGDCGILDILRASMSLPFVLKPMTIGQEKRVYVDGGLTCDHPWFAFAEAPPNPANVLDLRIDLTSCNPSTFETPLKSAVHYITSLFQCTLWNKSLYLLENKCKKRIVVTSAVMPLLPIRMTRSGLNVDITADKIFRAYQHGLELFNSYANGDSCNKN